MSHNALALTWSHLEERTDIANILHEAIGQHTVIHKNLLPDETHELTKLSFWRLITLFKISFDIQRTYLQSRKPSVTLKEYLLAPRQLLLFLSYLCHIASDDQCASFGPSFYDDGALKVILGQTLVSGVRTLVLQHAKSFASGESVELGRIWTPTAEEVEELKSLRLLLSLFHTYSSDTPLCSALFELSQKGLAGLLDESDDHYSHVRTECCTRHGALDLPDFAVGLFPMKPMNLEIVQRAVACMEGVCPQHLTSFWTCYDARWATVAASISMASKDAVPLESPSTSDTVQQFMRRRDQITEAIFASHIPPSQKWQPRWLILAGAPYQSCLSEDCACFASMLQTLPSTRETQPTALQEWRHPQVDKLMKSLQLFLIKRKDGLRDSGRTTTSLVTSFTQSLHDWTETQNLPSGRETSVESPWQVYVLGCPQMHPIFADDLLQRIPYLDDRESIQQEAPLLQLRHPVICPHCDQEYHVKQARLLQPLLNLARSVAKQQLQPALAGPDPVEFEELAMVAKAATRPGLVIPRGVSRAASPPGPEQGAISIMAPRDAEAESLKSITESPPPSAPQRNGKSSSQQASKRISTTFFARKPPKSAMSVRHTFSSSGNCILAWTSEQLAIVDVSRMSTSTISLANISHAAVGCKLVAVVTSGNLNHTLKILHDLPDVRANIGINCDLYSIAVSPDDAKVALGSATQILIYSAHLRQMKVLNMPAIPVLPDAKNVKSQVMAYSSDGEFLAVATHYDIQAARVCVFNKFGDVLYSKLYAMPLSGNAGSGELGFSAIACHAPSGAVYLGAFSNETFPRVFNFRNEQSLGFPIDAKFRKCPGTRIQCAAGSLGKSAEPCFAIVNEQNAIFRMRRNSEEKWGVKEACTRLTSKVRKTVFELNDRMSIAMTSPDDILLFWVPADKSPLKGILARSRLDVAEPDFREVELRFTD